MTAAPKLLDDARDLVEALAKAGAEFVVVGAHALAAHGIPRATADFDVLVRPSEANAARVMQALHRFGAPVEAHGVTAVDFARAGTVYQLGLPPRRIDILTEITGVAFDEAWNTRLEVLVDDLRLPVLGRQALIKNKRATGRDKDRLDVEALEREK